MKKTVFFRIILSACFFCLNIGIAIAKQTENIHPHELQRETNLQQIRIIIPEGSEWMQAAEGLKEILETKHKSDVELKIAGTAFPDLWSGNTILIGNLGNNLYFSRLYAMRYTFADDCYPGNKGYQLQTLVNPFGKGGNTVIVGVSDLEGLEKGVKRLEKIIKSARSQKLPWLNEAVLADNVKKLLTNSSLSYLDRLLERLSPANEANTHTLNLFNRIGMIAENYHLTGNEEAGEYYKKAMLGFADFMNEYPDKAIGHLNERRNMWIQGPAFYAGWFICEPSPLFNENERKRITSAVYTVLNANSRDAYLRSAPNQTPRNNHETYPAISLLSGSMYFLNHYPHLASTVQAWYTTAEQMFTNNTAVISRDDGSDYMMHVPLVTLDYALITGDRRFLNDGLRASADLQIMLLDNLGVMAGGGDTYPFGRSSAYHWGHSGILYAASWFYNDPKYQYLLERVKDGPFPNQTMGDLSRPLHYYRTATAGQQPPDWQNQALVQANRFDAGVYEAIAIYDNIEEITVPQEDAFHKLGFRRGLAADDSYLVLDGNAAGRAHNHHDANTILRYSENGRILLDTRDYLERGPEHKTGVVVVKDGTQHTKPVLAKVNWVGELNGIALSQTELQDYNGADWQRAIVSPGGRFFLILDHIQIKENGNYMLENVWQSLGRLSIKPDRFEVEQAGVTMTLQSLDESQLRTNDRYHHFKQYYRRNVHYPYADTENVLREVKEEAPYKSGESFLFVNVLSSSTSDKTVVEAERLGKNTFRLIENDEEWLAIWRHQEENTSLTTDGELLLFNKRLIVAAGMKSLSCGSFNLNFEESVMLYMDIEQKTWKAYSGKTGMLCYDENGFPVAEKVISSGRHDLTVQDVERIQSEWAITGDTPEKPANPPVTSDIPQGWYLTSHIEEEIVSSAAGDLDGDKTAELIIATVTGNVYAINAGGKVLWAYKSRSRVNELTVSKYEERTLVTVANENWTAHVLDNKGKLIWRKEFTPTGTPTQGSLIGITNIRIAHVDGKGQAPWFMVGSSFRNLYGVDINGKELYNEEAYYYGVMDMQFADYAGTGKDMGILGMEYVYPVVFTEKEKPLTHISTRTDPGWKVVRTISTPQINLFGVVFGTKEHLVHYAMVEKETLRIKWSTNVGGEVNDMQILNYKNAPSEILVGSSGHQVYVLKNDGTVKWRAYTGDRVLRVKSLYKNNTEYILAGLDNGKLLFINSNGAIEQRIRFSSNIENILTCDETGKIWVVLQDGRILSN